ncbi:MAG: FIST C-terminal domain-containing protein, partial [Planctomycetes bacterium]|nr:FIST C-terminal domain-containing protein [Planctomycetota bacterium]
PRIEEAVERIARELEPRQLIGCSAEGVIEGCRELELEPALSLWAASLPGSEVVSAHVSAEQTTDGLVFHGVPAVPEGPATMLIIGDPFTFPAHDFIERLAEDRAELQVLGGMASGGRSPGSSRLILGPKVVRDGAAVAVISGRARVRPVVSQGCRPFGKHLVVTRAEQNVIFELGGAPALEKLREQLAGLTPAEKKLLERGLHLGIAIDARRREQRRGDFLVRNVAGYSTESGALVVTDLVRPGTTVQFHLRDAETASEDLHLLLREARGSGPRAKGGILFTCNGRGRRLFTVPHHDAARVAGELGAIPLAGFFAAGEIGPVGGKSFLHGFTASLALFEEAEEDPIRLKETQGDEAK